MQYKSPRNDQPVTSDKAPYYDATQTGRLSYTWFLRVAAYVPPTYPPPAAAKDWSGPVMEFLVVRLGLYLDNYFACLKGPSSNTEQRKLI